MDTLRIGTRVVMALILALNAVGCRDVSAPGSGKRAFVYLGVDYVVHPQLGPVQNQPLLVFRTADGSAVNEVPLGQSLGFVSHVECSPDGSQAVFVAAHPSFWKYLLINSDGTGLRELVMTGASIGPGGWSPTGDRLAVKYSKPGAAGIAIMNTDGTVLATFPVSGLATAPLYLSWSPDGTEILYAAEGPQLVLRIMALSVTTSATRQIAASGYQPRWSPDGQRIAYLSSAGLVVVNKDGTSANVLVPAGTQTYSFTWTPDGRILVEQAGKLFFVSLGGTVTPFIPEVGGSWVHWCGTP